MTTSKPTSKTASRRRRKIIEPSTARSMDDALDAAIVAEAPHQTGAPDPDHAAADPVTEPVTDPVTEPVTSAAPASGPVAAAAPAAPAAPGETATQVMNDTIARLDGDLTQMEALLAQLAGEQEATETTHAAHAASSPLALRLELVGCQFASEIYPQGQHASNIPQYVWGELRCPFGKSTPDQDCRDCIHHKIIPLGANEAAYTRRYPRYGAVVALSDDDATALAHYLKALGRPALRRVASERMAVEQAIARAREARAAEVRREIERQQGGR